MIKSLFDCTYHSLSFQHFHSNREHKSVRKNYYKARVGYQSFDPLLHARFFRMKLHAWRGRQCLSLELYGCESGE